MFAKHDEQVKLICILLMFHKHYVMKGRESILAFAAISVSGLKTELQTSGSIEDNSKIIFLISQQKLNIVTPH